MKGTLFGLTVGSFLLSLGLIALQATVSGTPVTFPSTFWAWSEVIGFVAGVLGVYLIIKQNLWTWPVGILNVCMFAVFFFVEAKHYANGALQLIYLAYQIEGWIRWRRGERGGGLSVNRATRNHWIGILLTVLIGTLALAPLLERLGGQVPFWDALTFSIFLAAQVLVNRKIIENWWLWMIGNGISIPLYLSRSYYPTAAFYVVMFVMAIVGWREWRQSLNST